MKLLLGLALLSTTAIAQDVCRVDGNRATQSFGLDRAPNFFISADPNGRYVGVIGAGTNHVYDMNSGSPPRSVRVPGAYDPVFTPDGRYVTVPPGRFYDAEAYRRGIASGIQDMSNENQNFLGQGSGANAAYQSVGTLSETAQKSQYLDISDSQQNNPTSDLSYFIAEVDHQGRKMNTVRQGVLCPNIGEAHTPMISPDGEYLSVLNPLTRSTQIYRVDLNGGNCRMVSDLGVPTGKVSFDYNSNPRRLAFHVDQANTNVGWFPQIANGINKDTFVMELDVQNAGAADETWDMTGIQRLGVQTEGNTGTYYPRFRRDGTVIAITDHGSDRYSIDVFNPDHGKTLAPSDVSLVDPVTGCSPEAAGSFAALAIASMWQEVCARGQLPLRMRDALRLTPWLNRNACVQLIDQQWERQRARFIDTPLLRDELTRQGDMFEGSTSVAGKPSDLFSEAILGMSKEQLQSFCPQDWSEQARGETAVTVAEVQADTPQQTFNRQCGGCHSTQDAKGGLAFMTMNGEANTRAYDPATGQSGLTPANAELALNAFLNPNTMPSRRMPPAGAPAAEAMEKRRMAEYLLQFVQPESRRQRYIDMAGNL